MNNSFYIDVDINELVHVDMAERPFRGPRVTLHVPGKDVDIETDMTIAVATALANDIQDVIAQWEREQVEKVRVV